METIGFMKNIEMFTFAKQETDATDNRATASSFFGQDQGGGPVVRDLPALKRPASSEMVKSHVGLFSPVKRRRHCGHSSVGELSRSASRVGSLALKAKNTWASNGPVTSSTHLVKQECPPVKGAGRADDLPWVATASSPAHPGKGCTPFEDICLKQLLEVSRHKLFRSLEEVRGNDARHDSRGDEPRAVRCRSLPSRMTPEKNSADVPIGGWKNQSASTLIHSNLVSSLLTVSHKDDQETSDSCHDDDDDDRAVNDSEGYDMSECDDSGPPTPSSGFIDIEADTPPCSPLNLTTTGESVSQLFHSSVAGVGDRQQSTASPDTKTPHVKSKSEDAAKEKLGLCCCGAACSGSTCKEKKTNFSIDAILRPDFGSGNFPNQDGHTFQPNDDHQIVSSSQTNPRFSSPDSAFKVVDLRTRSRSESLSSPSSSSSSSRSSPSPPLTSPVSLRQKWERETGSFMRRHLKGQEHFSFPQSLFPNPSKDLENFIGRHFPFISPPQGNPIVKFPNIFPPDQLAHLHPAMPAECVDPRTFYYAPENFLSKGQQPILSYDMSKLFGRSLHPFLNSPPKPQPQKRLGHHLAPPPAEGVTLKSAITNQNPKLLPEVKASGQSAHVDQKKRSRDDSASKSKQAADQDVHLKENSQKADPVLKQEKANRKDSPAAVSPDTDKAKNPLWPAWVFCTRYSDRPSSGPRSRKPKRSKAQDEKRPRTAFTNDQLQRLKREFDECRYLTETRRKNLADELGLTESQIKIWFQNKRAKIKKSVGVRNPLALQLMEQGLYNHSTIKEMMEEGMYPHTPPQAGDDSS